MNRLKIKGKEYLKGIKGELMQNKHNCSLKKIGVV